MEFSDLCFSKKPDFVCIAEPMVSYASIPLRFWISLNLTLIAHRDDLLPVLLFF